MTFGKHYLAIKKHVWKRGVLSGDFNQAWEKLDFTPLTPCWENFEPLIKKIETGVKWSDLASYTEEAMEQVWKNPDTRLYLLTRNEVPVGYSLITSPKRDFISRFKAANDNETIIEIENLALFKNSRGKGMGKAFFEMMFKEMFKTYDVVCWGTSDFNASSLVNFYTSKLKMKILGYDEPKSKVA